MQYCKAMVTTIKSTGAVFTLNGRMHNPLSHSYNMARNT